LATIVYDYTGASSLGRGCSSLCRRRSENICHRILQNALQSACMMVMVMAFPFNDGCCTEVTCLMIFAGSWQVLSTVCQRGIDIAHPGVGMLQRWIFDIAMICNGLRLPTVPKYSMLSSISACCGSGKIVADCVMLRSQTQHLPLKLRLCCVPVMMSRNHNGS
jgi:hypothetical protein